MTDDGLDPLGKNGSSAKAAEAVRVEKQPRVSKATRTARAAGTATKTRRRGSDLDTLRPGLSAITKTRETIVDKRGGKGKMKKAKRTKVRKSRLRPAAQQIVCRFATTARSWRKRSGR